MKLEMLLKEAVARGATDLHLTCGLPPYIRKNGQLEPLGSEPALDADMIRELVRQVIPDQTRELLSTRGEVDFSWGIPSVGRFRVNAYRQRGSIAAAIRLIPYQIPSLEQLGMPQVVGELARKKRGLVLVTGPTGSGKSTTLAALVDKINSVRRCHILTLEDPIEYLHSHKQSIVNQREIGSDSDSFAPALRAALRQDPDVILVGEMRDLETIATAITAAETGHLVLATVHTKDAPGAVERIIDVFPPHQQQQVRVQLASTLVAVVAQQLLPKTGGGLVAAVEVLVATGAVRNLIREGKTYQLPMTIQTGGSFGMRSMDQALRQLHSQGKISYETALLNATVPSELKGQLAGGAG
jgi:twitching motility protein PilT